MSPDGVSEDYCGDEAPMTNGAAYRKRQDPPISFERRRELNAIALKMSQDLRSVINSRMEKRLLYEMIDALSDDEAHLEGLNSGERMR